MKKKFLLLGIVVFLASCTSGQKISNKAVNPQLPAISNWAITWIYVAVSDPHIYSHMWPEVISGSFYFDPRYFYNPVKNLSIFSNAYYNLWNTHKVYYYDENGGAQAWLVVYILRNYFHKNNVSLLLSDKLQKLLKYHQKIKKIPKDLENLNFPVTGWYLWTGKYRIVYDPTKINFKTWDLLLYSSDIWTMKNDAFYQKNNWKISIKSFDWSILLTIDKWIKPKSQVAQLLSGYNFERYNTVYIYYPNYRYRSAVLALYLQENYK